MTHIRQANETEIRLWGAGEFGLPVKSLLFGELVKLTQPIVQHYQSDLYHDVHWVDEHVTGPTEFYFGCDAWGTAIGTDPSLVHTSRQNMWRVKLSVRNSGTWYATITQVTP